MLKLIRIAFVSLCCFAIYALFRQESWEFPESITDFDKIGHLVLFFSLSFSGYFVFISVHPIVYQLPLLLLAGISEWFQSAFLPQRHFSVGDIEADLMGILLGFLFSLICRRRNWRFK